MRAVVLLLVLVGLASASQLDAQHWAGKAKLMQKLKQRIAEAEQGNGDSIDSFDVLSSGPNRETSIDGNDPNNVVGPDYLQPTVDPNSKDGDGNGCDGHPMMDEYDKMAIRTIGCNPEADLQKSREDLARVAQEITAAKIKKVQEEMQAEGDAMAARDTAQKKPFNRDDVVQKYFPTTPLGAGAPDAAAEGATGAPAMAATGAEAGETPVTGEAPAAADAGADAGAAPVDVAAAPAEGAEGAAAPAEGAEGAGGAAGAAVPPEAVSGGATGDPAFEKLMTDAGLAGNHMGSGSGSSFVFESDEDVHGDLKAKLEQIGRESVATGGDEGGAAGGSGSGTGGGNNEEAGGANAEAAS